MRVKVPYGRTALIAEIPGNVEVVTSAPVSPMADVAGAVAAGLERPIGAEPLADLLHRRRARTACVVVPDPGRGLPAEAILTPLLGRLAISGLHPDAVTLLVAGGLGRPMTPAERLGLFGPTILSRYRILEHDPLDAAGLVQVAGAGPAVGVNRHYAEADVTLAVGLIEPHPVFGYTGGAEGLCPGLVDAGTVERLLAAKVVGGRGARPGVLAGNAAHQAALAVARRIGADLVVNVTLDHLGRVVGVYAGGLEPAHEAGVRELAGRVLVEVIEPADVVITTGGGFPADATFCSSVRGMAAAAEVARPGAAVLCAAACQGGIGSHPFRDLLLRYAGDYRRFLKDIARGRSAVADQWVYQVLGRVLDKVGVEGLFCLTDGIVPETVAQLSVSAPVGDRRTMLQRTFEVVAARFKDPHVVVIPEGPRVIATLGR